MECCVPLQPSRAAPEIREAPLFEPTEEEFADPMAYIRSKQKEAYKYGIFRVQPPPSWAPPKCFHRHRANEAAGGGQRSSRGTNVGNKVDELPTSARPPG